MTWAQTEGSWWEWIPSALGIRKRVDSSAGSVGDLSDGIEALSGYPAPQYSPSVKLSLDFPSTSSPPSWPSCQA